MGESDFERYCIACGYAACRCGKNYHPTVNEVHAMYQHHAKLVGAVKDATGWGCPTIIGVTYNTQAKFEEDWKKLKAALEAEVGDDT